MNRRNTLSRRTGGLPTAALMLALGAGVPSLGQAEPMPQLVVTAQKAPHGTAVETLRNTMQVEAQEAVSATRISVATELGLRLTGQHRAFRVASTDPGKRG